MMEQFKNYSPDNFEYDMIIEGGITKKSKKGQTLYLLVTGAEDATPGNPGGIDFQDYKTLHCRMRLS